jgi:hypothetical protein
VRGRGGVQWSGLTVETVRGDAVVQKVLLKGNGNGGLSRGGQAGQPKSKTLLTVVLVALLAGETGVPGDVTAAIMSIRRRYERRGKGEATNVAIFVILR